METGLDLWHVYNYVQRYPNLLAPSSRPQDVLLELAPA